MRTSISQATMAIGIDFGTHQRFINSGLVHAANTMCAGASNVRVTTRSRSPVRSTFITLLFGSLFFLALTVLVFRF